MKIKVSALKNRSYCKSIWKKLKKSVSTDEVELCLVLELLGVRDALWALQGLEGKDQELRLFAADCAQSALHRYEEAYPEDDRPRKAIQAARDYANGKITQQVLESVWANANDASRDSYTYDASFIASAAASASVCADPHDTSANVAFYAARNSAEHGGWDIETQLFKKYFCN